MFSKTLLLFVSLFGFAAASLMEVDPLTGVILNRRLGAKDSSLVASSEQLRKLMDDCSNVNTDGDTIFLATGCGFPYEDAENKWCYSDGSNVGVCFGDDESDCCELSGGSLAIIIVVVLVAIFGIALCSCACCACCPLHDKLCCSKNRGNKGTTASAEVVVAPGTKDEGFE